MENTIKPMKIIEGSVYEKQQKLIEKKEEQKKQVNQKEYTGFQIWCMKVWSKRSEILIGLFYAYYVSNILYNIIQVILSTIQLDLGMLTLIPLKAVIDIVGPFILWMQSTRYTYYNYHRRKLTGIYIAAFSTAAYIGMFAEWISYSVWVPIIFKIPTGTNITPTMIVSLGRLIICLFTALAVGAYIKLIVSTFTNELTKKQIIAYKIDRNRDRRKHPEFAYDMEIVHRLDTGEKFIVKEKDRFLHSLINGSTGTGKTSTCHTVAINGDFDQRMYNEDWQKKELFKLVQKRKIRATKDFDDGNFSANYFEVVDEKDKKTRKKLSYIQTVAPVAGVTAMAPNASFADEIYNLANAKGLKVNRVDPELADGVNHKEGFLGFNPYYISHRLTGIEREIEVFSRSTMVADVLQAIFDKSGSSDPYFASLNQNITTTITTTLLLTHPSLHNGVQPTLKALQSIINDFSKIKPYRDELIYKFAVNKNPDGSPVMDAGRADIGEYQFLLDTIDGELLGQGATKMFDQARGLKIIINEVLANPLIRDVLCAENSIDLDEMLADGHITVVNYALKLGSAGTAFGLFFMLSYIKAVIRRPGTEKTRLPHFFYVDEFPTLLHRDEDLIFTYFRQFRCAAMIAIQTIEQMDRIKETAFLKSVLTGNCATQILFGRSPLADLKNYKDLAGTVAQVQEMLGHSETSLTTDNPSYTSTTRETVVDADLFTTGEMRMLDFQEVTVFSVNNGSPVLPFYGKVDFLPAYKQVRRKRKNYNWHQYFEATDDINLGGEDILITSIPVSRTSVNQEEETKETKTVSASTKVIQKNIVPVKETKENLANLLLFGSEEEENYFEAKRSESTYMEKTQNIDSAENKKTVNKATENPSSLEETEEEIGLLEF